MNLKSDNSGGVEFQMNGLNEDVFFLSNGHISPLLYSVLARRGYFSVSELSSFRKLNSRLQGHPTPHEHLEGIRIASGSLGQGLSVAIGVAQAKKLIEELNSKIAGLASDLAKAQAENKQLTAQNQDLTSQNTSLNSNLTNTTKEKERIQDIASTLHASTFNIQPLRIKEDGSEKQTNNTRKANTLRLTFQIDRNKITPSGAQDLYVCVTGPDGKLVGDGGSFTTREDGQRAYSNKITVQYEQNAVLPVNYDIKQSSKLAEGDYKIEVYNNGFKIGEGKTTMKKSLLPF
jgi:hypothetical protein